MRRFLHQAGVEPKDGKSLDQWITDLLSTAWR